MLEFYVVRSDAITITATSVGNATVSCDSGDQVTGGGYLTDPGMINISPYWNGPSSSAWRVGIRNLEQEAVKFTAYAVCADMTP